MYNSQKINIKKWILEVTESGSWEKYDNLYIDDIDTKCNNPSQWVKKGIEFLNEAIMIRNKLKLEYAIALGIELTSVKKHEEFKFENLNEINKIIGNSPPSLYAFLPKWKNWQETLKGSFEIKNIIVAIKGFTCSYYEYFSPHDKEYRRTIFIWNNP